MSRRELLGCGVGLAGGVAITGCTARGDDAVTVLAAGSLQHALATRFREQVGEAVQLEAHGSAACAQLVAEGLRDPDVLALADPVLFDGLTDTYTAFATNALVVAHTETTAVGRRIGSATVPLNPLFDDSARFGRTDPDADPLGYRTLFAFRSAREEWGREYPRLLEPGQLFPETELLTVAETGALDAVIAYRNMAVDHGVPFRTLPPTVDFSAPRLADRYSRYEYELPSGTVVEGAPITYGAALRHETPAAQTAFQTLVGGDWLGPGFDVPRSFPVVRDLGRR